MQTPNRPVPENLDDEIPGEERRCGVSELPPPDLSDPVVEMYKRDVDRTLLVKNLELTPAQRAEKLADFVGFLNEMRGAARRLPHQGA